MTNFSSNIKALRKAKGLTQEQIADSIGIPRTTWSSYEIGASEPSIDGIIRIANFFGVDPGSILSADASLMDKPGEHENASPNASQSASPKRKNRGELQDNEDRIEYDGKSEKTYKEDLINTLKKLVETQDDTISILKSKLSEAQQKIKEMEAEKAKKKPSDKSISTR